MIKDIQQLFEKFDNAYTQHKLQNFNVQDFSKYQKNSQRSMCQQIIQQNSTTMIYCIDCALRPNFFICQECFDIEKHIDHKFFIYDKNINGTCDCGNENVWKASGFCKNHGKNQQKIMIDEKQKQKFIKDWQTIFIWLLQLNDNNMQKCKDFANKILTFLKNLSQNSEYYSSLIGSLLVKKLELNKQQKKKKPLLYQKKDCFLDLFLTKIKQKTLVYEFSQFFKSLLSSEEFKKHLTISFLNNINQIPIINGSEQKGFEYLIFYQVLAHQQLVSYAFSEKYLLAYNHSKTVDNIGIYKFSVNLNYAYKYICNSQKVKYQYWKKHINSNHITCICLYQPFTEEIWNRKKRSPQQENFLINIIEFQYDFFFQLVFKIAEIIQQDKSLLLKAISDLYKHILKLQMTTNRYSLPYHRMLCVFLFTYFQFDLSNIDSNLQKLINYLQLNKQKGLENKIITPVLNCIQNYLLLKDKLKSFPHTPNTEKKIYGIYNNAKMILNIDMLFIKIFTLFNKSKESFFFPRYKSLDVNFNTYLQRIKLINELCISLVAQINIEFLIKKSNQKNHKAAQNLISSFLCTTEICDIKKIKIFQEEFLPKEFNLCPYLNNISEFNCKNREFTYISPNKIYLDIEYYCTKSKVKNILIKKNNIQQNNIQQLLEISKQKITQNFFMKEITLQNLENLQKLLVMIDNTQQESNLITKKNIQKQLMKLYYISQAIQCSQISQYLQKLISNNTAFNQLEQKKKNLNEKKKPEIKQPKKKKMASIRNKQNAQSIKNVQKAINHNQQEKCLSCSQNLNNGTILAYPILVQFSNLYYSSKLKGIEKNINQQNNQNSILFYKLLSDYKKQNIVFISCYHQYHYQCMIKMPRDFVCKHCTRHFNNFVVIAASTQDKLNCFFESIEYFKQRQDSSLICIFKSTIEILSYLGSLQIQVFVKKFIKLYKNMVAIQKIIYNRMTEIQKLEFQYDVNKQQKVLKNYLNQKKYLIQKSSKIDYDKYAQHDLQILTKNILYQYLKNDKIVLRDRLQQYISNDNKYNEFLINRLSFVHYLITPQCQEPYFFKQSNQQMLKTLSLNKKQPIIITLVQPLFFRQLPPKFLPLNKYRGRCPNCKKISDGKCICLLCNWEGCKGCQSMKLWQHTKQAHFRQSIFLNIESTKLIYVSQRFAYVSRGLYVNEYGDQFKIKQDWDKFSLNLLQYQLVKRSIIEYNLIQFQKIQKSGIEFY